MVLLKFLFQQKANLRQKGENGIDVLCVPVMGRDKDGKEVILGVLEAVYPTPTDVIGEETTDSFCVHISNPASQTPWHSLQQSFL